MAKDRDQMLASGKTQTQEQTEAASEAAHEPVEDAVLPEERKVSFRTPGFARMKLDWNTDDRPVVERAKAAVEGRIIRLFGDAYAVMYDLYKIVRTPVVDPATGEPKVDQFGFYQWEQDEAGDYIEDWSNLGMRQREDFLFKITTRLFDWEQRAADLWMESMLAKGQWEERFASQYDAPVSGTIDDRRARGNMHSTDERYFAIYTAALSKKADAVVRTMTLLSQRIKDSMQT